MSQKMWMKIQTSHATNPDAVIQPKSATADPRPIVAMFP